MLRTSRTQSASWPSASVPESSRRLLDLFFTLMDDSSKEAAEQLASRVFTSDATLISSGGTFKGSTDIIESRSKAWLQIKTKYHQVNRVFSATDDGSDLLMIGRAVLELKNGRTVEGDFIGHAVIEGIRTEDPKLSVFRAWGDTGPMIKALAG